MQLCIVCGKSYISKRGRKYCSNACRNQKWKLSQRENYLASGARYRQKFIDNTPERLPIILRCVICSKEFEQNKYHPEQICCSRICSANNFKSNHADLVKKWKKEERKRHRGKYKIINALYKDKIRYSGNQIRALCRDDYTCQLCSYQSLEPYKLSVHHKDGTGTSDKPNNRIENLQTLCRACHARIHSSLK